MTAAKNPPDSDSDTPQTQTTEIPDTLDDAELGYKLILVLNQRTMDKLKRAQALVSRDSRASATIPKTLEDALDRYLEMNCPAQRQERRRARTLKQQARGEQASTAPTNVAPTNAAPTNIAPMNTAAMSNGPMSNGPAHGKKINKPKPREESRPTARRSNASRAARLSIPAALRDAVYLRDGGACTYAGRNSKRCNSTHEVHIDHRMPVALGGESTLDNLRTLCRAHNQREADRVFGRAFMDQRRDASTMDRELGSSPGAGDATSPRPRPESRSLPERE